MAITSIVFLSSPANGAPPKRLFTLQAPLASCRRATTFQIAPSFLRGAGNFIHCFSRPNGSQVKKLPARVYNGDPASSTAVIHFSAVTSADESPMAPLAPTDQQLPVRGISTRAISDTPFGALKPMQIDLFDRGWSPSCTPHRDPTPHDSASLTAR